MLICIFITCVQSLSHVNDQCFNSKLPYLYNVQSREFFVRILDALLFLKATMKEVQSGSILHLVA